jgi:isopenicillin-N epimerase
MDSNTTFGSGIRHHWHLEDDMYFLNNGSFGATPKDVLLVQDEWRKRMERQPIRFVMRELPAAIRNSASIMGEYLGADGEDIVFVDNASTGVNTVLRSLLSQLKPGDELLTTSHVYNAVRQTMLYVCSLTGAKYVEVEVPFPFRSSEDIVSAVKQAITPRTVFAMFDHITSPTGIVFPIQELVEVCKEHNIQVMIDGAHTPGMVDINLNKLGADWFTGNFHKWLFAPKGSAFLWTAKKNQSVIHSPIISHGYTMGYHAEFDFNGTKDWSPFLSAPDGLAFWKSLGGSAIRDYNNDLTLKARSLLLEAVPQEIPVPNELLASLATIVLPLAITTDNPMAESTALHDIFWDKYSIEVPIFPFAGSLLLRVAVQCYNELREYERLASVLPDVIREYQERSSL